MDTVMTRDQLAEILDQAVREVAERTAGVRLCPSGGALSDDVCTVYIFFRKDFDSSLTLCADTALLKRMARNALWVESPTPQDLEDFAKEYFNILCGKIAAALFQNTKVPVRFSVPQFYHGHFAPEDCWTQLVLSYVSEDQEGARLIHHVPRRRQDAAN